MAADAEFSYYLEHASPSASIKNFLKDEPMGGIELHILMMIY